MGKGFSILQATVTGALLSGCALPDRSLPGSGMEGFAAPPTKERTDPTHRNQDNSRASRLDHFFDISKDLGFTYDDIDTVMRALAYATCQRTFPSEHYSILDSVQYDYGEGHTVGELDLIVWNRQQDVAERVYEVKLTGDPDEAYKRSMQQLGRFRRCIQYEKIKQFRRGPQVLRITQDQFRRVSEYGSIGNRGTASAGFSLEIDITPDEAAILLERLRTYRE